MSSSVLFWSFSVTPVTVSTISRKRREIFGFKRASLAAWWTLYRRCRHFNRRPQVAAAPPVPPLNLPPRELPSPTGFCPSTRRLKGNRRFCVFFSRATFFLSSLLSESAFLHQVLTIFVFIELISSSSSLSSPPKRSKNIVHFYNNVSFCATPKQNK